MMDDHELLQSYAQQGSDEAFSILVRRHLDLVYSAARRQVRSRELTEEVVQSVFMDLARSARKIKSTQPLAAWLFLVARRTAIDALRKESRRLAMEKTVGENAAADNTPAGVDHIEPLLDEAIASLSETDRRVILLRFFEDRSLREVGRAMGASEDAAQKRVSRALAQLREFFSKRGLAISSASVATQLSANAVVPAPALLATNIASFTALAAASTKVSQIILMTTLKKIAVAGVLTLGFGVVVYEARELSVVKEKKRRLEATVEALTRETAALRAERELALKRLASTEGELAAFKGTGVGNPEMESALEAWLERVGSLSNWLDKMPDKRIPQLRLLTEEDWLEAAKTAKFGNELEVRESLAKLRDLALKRFEKPMNDALAKYREENPKDFPATPDALLPYFDPLIEPDLLQNYEIIDRLAGGLRLVDRSGTTSKLVLRNKVVDDIYDFRRSFMPSGGAVYEVVNLSHRAIEEAVRDYRELNRGQAPVDPTQLTPYLKRAIHPEYLKKAMAEVAASR